MINVWIDEFTPCLKDAVTGGILETEVVRVTRKNYLAKYNCLTRGYINWADLLKGKRSVCTCDKKEQQTSKEWLHYSKKKIIRRSILHGCVLHRKIIARFYDC